MPFIHITIGRPATASQKQAIARQATSLIADIMHKRAEVTAVNVVSAAADAWYIAGEPVAEALIPAHCAIYITAGTNSADEKAAILAALHSLLGETLGPLPEASYIVIHEIAADSWGYGGLTQAARQKKASTL